MVMKHLRNLLLVLALFLLSLWVGWMAANVEQRQQLLVFLGLEHEKQPEGMAAREDSQPTAPGQSPKQRRICRHPPVSACRPRKATNVVNIADKVIYRWKDDNGQTHFSDQPPEDNEADVVQTAAALSPDRFKLSIKFDGLSQLPGFRDQVNSGSERIYRFFRSHLNQGDLPALNVRLVVAGNTERFEAYRRELAPTSRTNSGFYDHASNQALVRYRAGDTGRTVEVARHEIAHLILGNIYGDTDTWLSEGLAELFERMDAQFQTAQVKVARQDIETLRKALRTGKLPSLKKLMSSSYPTWYRIDVHLMYAYAWSLVHYLVGSDSARPVLEGMLQRQKLARCEAFSSPDYLQEHYPGGLQGLDRDWRRWLFDSRDKTLYY
jgi:hypothetical protein